MRYEYKTENVCPQIISFDIDGDIISDVNFIGGCNGNLKAVSKLVNGWTVDKIEEYLRGNICGYKPTSCADQLAIAVRKAYNETNKETG